jgi:hypothetical protein
VALLDMDGNAVSSGFGHYLGFSSDGYIVAKDNAGRARLFKLPVESPRLNIVRENAPDGTARVKITWDADSSWKLQSTTNFPPSATWLDLPEATSPCWFNADRACFFRLKK